MPVARNPWYAEGLRFECRACGGCCGGFPGFVWVTPEEAEAAGALLGVTGEEFLERYARRVGSRYTLREVENWDCVMLEDGKCHIYEARPVQCRTYPFWTENLRSRRAWESASAHCPGMNEGRLHTFEEIERARLLRP